ncbi:hypothetical protein GQ53DRAFT_167396 [Thozetella sp. PMI_491]|nr:hypothetical protein GQ53DRAFT_167396 [Thozetella sp. PMI_491]
MPPLLSLSHSASLSSRSLADSQKYRYGIGRTSAASEAAGKGATPSLLSKDRIAAWFQRTIYTFTIAGMHSELATAMF